MHPSQYKKLSIPMLWDEDEQPPEKKPFFPEKFKYDPGAPPVDHSRFRERFSNYRPSPSNWQGVLKCDTIEKAVDNVPPSIESTVRHTTDFDNPSAPNPKANKKTKQRTIFTKNMFQTMPKLKWLPGECHLIGNSESDADAIQTFIQTARTFQIVSLMIFAEVEGVYSVNLFTLSTPLCTLIFDVREARRFQRRISLPKGVYELLSQPKITVVCPGATDWHYSQAENHRSLLLDIVDIPTSTNNVKYIQSFEDSLHINRSGKDICAHMKMLHWLFQIKIGQLHGGPIRSYPLSETWQQYADCYGKSLIYLYWALCMKQEIFDRNPKLGVDMSPIYLEDLIIEKRLTDITDKKELHTKLFGPMERYPNPPLPNLP